MRVINLCFTIAVFLIGSFSSVKAASPIFELGKYYHKPTNRLIVLEKTNSGILVQGISKKGLVHFDRVGKRLFMDKNGNRIEIKQKRKITFVAKNSRRGQIFFKVQENQGLISNTPIQNQGTPISAHTPNKKINLEGVWHSYSIGEDLIIVETRDGLKARLKKEKKWHVYYRTSENMSTFTSNDGNTYVINSDGSLNYYHKNQSNPLVFEKKSEFID